MPEGAGRLIEPVALRRYVALCVLDFVPDDGSGNMLRPDTAKRVIDDACESIRGFGYSAHEAEIISAAGLRTAMSAKREINAVLEGV